MPRNRMLFALLTSSTLAACGGRNSATADGWVAASASCASRVETIFFEVWLWDTGRIYAAGNGEGWIFNP